MVVEVVLFCAHLQQETTWNHNLDHHGGVTILLFCAHLYLCSYSCLCFVYSGHCEPWPFDCPRVIHRNINEICGNKGKKSSTVKRQGRVEWEKWWLSGVKEVIRPSQTRENDAADICKLVLTCFAPTRAVTGSFESAATAGCLPAGEGFGLGGETTWEPGRRKTSSREEGKRTFVYLFLQYAIISRWHLKHLFLVSA